jgi:hypothetical protein
MVFWVWDLKTKMLWHFHSIREIRAVYDNGLHQAPTGIIVVVQWHWAYPKDLHEYQPQDFSDCRRSFQYLQQVLDVNLDLAAFRLASELLVGERIKGAPPKNRTKKSTKQLEVWREKNILQHVLKAQARSLQPKTKIRLSKQQKEELLGVGNLDMVDNGIQRTLKIRKAIPEDKG